MTEIDKTTPFNETAAYVHKMNKEKGFWDEAHPNVGEKLMLIVTEVAEALEAVRRKEQPYANPDTVEYLKKAGFDKVLFEANIKNSFEDEIADTMIRLFDLAGYYNIDLDFHIPMKLKYNQTRGKKHGKNF